MGRLLNQAGIYLEVRGDRAGALTVAEKSVMLARETEGNDPLDLAVCLVNMGARYADLDRLDDAEAAYAEARAIEESRLNPNDPSLATTLAAIAGVHLKRNEFVEAESLLLRTAEINKAARGIESPEYGTSLGNLDALYDDWAEYSGDIGRRRIAEKYSTEALSVTRASRGLRHPETAARHYNLAILSSRLDDSRSVATAERAVAIINYDVT
jgi:tetratricopeptide (TPR) repeat protein